MNNYKNILLLWLVVMVLPGCASFGPTIRIETPEPTEDFVVLCEWHKAALIDFHGGGLKRSDWKVFVTESGKEVDCGVSFGGGDGSATIMHPVYMGGRACEIGCESGIVQKQNNLFVIKPRTLDELIDHNIKKYSNNKISKYLGSLYSDRYFKYYKYDRELDISRMRKLYDEDIKRYWGRVTKIYKNDGYKQKISTPDEYIKNYWKKANEAKFK